jgi:hypothetical protein
MTLKILKDALEKLETIHQDQIDSFGNSLLPDLEAQIEERQNAFSEIKTIISDMALTLDQVEDPKEIEELLTGIKFLIKQNSVLKSKAQTHKNDLKERMKQANKGKQAISAYGSPDSVRNRSKVINFRN